MTTIHGWKVLTHDYRPPIQGGDPIWNGSDGAIIRADRLDRGDETCAAGINFTREPQTALRIAGLWPDGRPSVLLRVCAAGDWVERGDKLRAEAVEVERVVTGAELEDAIIALSAPFGEHKLRMAASQLAWRAALARPRHNVRDVQTGLRTALKARELDWKLKRYDSAWAARDAWDAWAAWDAGAARAAWDAGAARAAGDAWAAWDAGAARAARVALTVEYASLQGWIKDDPDLLTTGLRDAYAAGLGIAVPVTDGVLGWAMDR